jgi:hypothetical protein
MWKPSASRVVELGAPIAEDAPRAPIRIDRIEVERRGQHRFLAAAGFGHLRAGVIRDERRPIERHARAASPGFGADAIRRDERHHVRRGMTLHRALPVIARVDLGRERLGADRRREEQHVGAHQRQRARRFREPLVPTDADADATVLRRPHLEAGIARREEVLLRVAGAIGNVRFAIRAEHAAIGIEHRDRVEKRLARALEDGDR